MGAEKILIGHSSKVNDIVGLQKIEEIDKQFLIKKNYLWGCKKEPIYYRNRKKPEIIIEIEKIIRYVGVFINLCLLKSQTHLFNTLTR